MIPLETDEAGSEMVTIWNATCEARRVGKQVDTWFSEVLGMPCQLVYMPDTSTRPVDTTSGYAPASKLHLLRRRLSLYDDERSLNGRSE